MTFKRSLRDLFALACVLVLVAPAGAQQLEENDDPFLFPAMTRRKSFQRGYWDLKQRAYPTGDIPAGSRESALLQIAQANSILAAPVQGNRWFSIGPGPMRDGQTTPPMPVTGRVTDVVVDPRDANRWLIGGAQGGVWETRDAGLTWTPLTDDQPSLSIGAIAFAPSNPDIIYVGTGEAAFSGDAYGGAGILKSTNNGATWRQLAATNFNQNCFSDLRVHPTNPDILVASVCRGTAGRGGSQVQIRPPRGMFRSTDGGITWSRRLGGEATDLEIDPSNFNNQFAAIGNVSGSTSNGVFRSTDAGVTWTRLFGPWSNLGGVGRIELALASTNASSLYVSIQDALGFFTFGTILGVWRSDDPLAGVPTWSTLPQPGTFAVPIGTQAWYDHELIVDPSDPNVIYLGEISLWKYDASGWTPLAGYYDTNVQGVLVHPDQHTMAWAGNRLILGNDGGVWSSTDGGVNWTGHNTTLALTQFYDGSIHPTNVNFAIAGCQDNGTSRWDGSNSWQFIWYGDGCDNAISRTRPDTDWAASSQFLSIVRTVNGAPNRAFFPADTGIDKSGAPFIARFEKSPNDDDIFIAGTDNLWLCTNFFTATVPRWRSNGPEMGRDITAIAFAPSDLTSSTYAFGTEFGDLRLTTNAGASWINIDIGNKVPDRYVTDLAFDPADSSVLCVTLSGFNDNTPGQPGHLFRTANASAANTIWVNISPPVDLPHNTLVFDPFDSSVMYVGTDIGVWKTIDSGVTWVHMGPATGMPNVAVFELQITHDPDNVVAFTHGRGAFQLRRSSTNIVDLVLNFSATPDPVTVGQSLTYRAIISNQGPSDASGVTFVDILPPGVSFVSALASQGSCNLTGRRLSCDLGSLTVGAVATVSLSVSPTSPGQLVNSGSVSADEVESNISNNSVTLTTTVANPAADLVLTAADSPDPIEAGRELVYSLAVTNLGPSVARSVAVNTLRPAGFDFVSAVSSQGSCDVTGGAVICSVGTIQAGDGATFTIILRPTVAGLFTNVVSVTASVSDPNPANNSVLLFTTVKPPAPVIVAAGARLVAETLANGGLDSNENVTVTFNLKNVGSLGTTDLVASLLPTNGVASPSARQSYGALPPDASVVGRSFTFTAVPTSDGIVTATLQLGDGTNDLGLVTYRFALTRIVRWVNAGGLNIPDNGPASVYPSPMYVSGMQGSVSRVSVILNGVSHEFPQDIDALLVAPAGPKVMFMSDAGGGTGVSGLRLTFDDSAPSLLPSSSAPASGTFKPTDYERGDTLPSPAPAPPFSTNLSALSGLDPNGTWGLYVADDQPGDLGRIAGGWELIIETTDPVDPNADLILQIADTPDPAMIGGNITYSITISNAGPDAAESVNVTNLLPASLSFVSASSSQGTCSNSAAGVVCHLGVLNSFASANITVVATANSAGLASVSATVRADVRDTFLANNSATATTTVSGAADLRLALSDSPDPVFINNTLTWTLSVSNIGPNAALGVTLSNTFPAGVTFVSALPSQGGCSPAAGLVNCSLGSIAAGGSATVTIQATTPSAVTILTNRAGVRASSPVDPNITDNVATAVTRNLNPSFIIVAAGALLESETAPPTGGIEAGERATVQLFLRNTGSADTTDLVATLLTGGGVTAPSSPQNYGRIARGAAAISRPFSFTAAATSNGILTATLQLAEGSINLGTVVFTFPLGSTVRFASPAVINIVNQGPASIYPAPMPVGGMAGLLAKVSVTLSNFTHSYPDDVDILLVSPGGQKALLLSDVGGAISVTNRLFTLDDAASALLPDSAALLSGTFRLSNFDTISDQFPSPAPAAPYAASLSAFNGAEPNGNWSLYINDDTYGDTGRIEGWSLTLTTVGRVNPAPARLLSPTILANGRVSFSISGEADATYVIEASTDLLNWVPVGSVSSGGSYNEPRSSAQRFYRALPQP
jgi:uncharacterized repeat protein (TIGR01451 family)